MKKIIIFWINLHLIMFVMTSLPKSNLYMINLVETCEFVLLGIILMDLTIASYIVSECLGRSIKKVRLLKQRKGIKSRT